MKRRDQVLEDSAEKQIINLNFLNTNSAGSTADHEEGEREIRVRMLPLRIDITLNKEENIKRYIIYLFP